MGRTLIVANRLPVTARRRGEELVLEPSAGGLATGLKAVHERAGSLWFGWSGLPEDRNADADLGSEEPWASLRLVPIPLSRAEVAGYYRGYSNGIVWPVFHSLLGRIPLAPGPWAEYERVNRRFADAVHARLARGDLVWVHDYHLMRVPALLRQRAPGASIGFFLHIPFPPAEIFAALPERELILEGLLGADVIGFHTAGYRDNFCAALTRLLGLVPQGATIPYRGRAVRVGVFPMGVDFERFSRRSESAEVQRLSGEYAAGSGAKLILGVDRLDYTKGIPRRFLAFERLLATHPELRERVRLVQLAVPSRSEVPAYRRFRQQIDALVGRINGTFGTPSWTPVHYLVRSLSDDELIGLYRATDVMLVTPVRDGMNLVAKEFVASRVDEDGVLVLSEFAGAADELREALHVNPYDVDRTASAIHRALTMEPAERQARMQALRQRVAASDTRRWTRSFLSAVRAAAVREPRQPAPLPAITSTAVLRATVQEHAAAATHLVLLLDYDGTVVPFAPAPSLARPDPGLLALLDALVHRPRTEVHILSGRDRDTLEAWFGSVGVALHAEHGLWSRPAGGEWVQAAVEPLPHREEILALMEQAASRAPGAVVERKSVGFAWHYRMVEPPRLAAAETRKLRAALGRLLRRSGADLLPGDHVLEVRPRGVDKGVVARRILTQAPPGALIIALGDDVTDEQLFAALPPEALTIHVGRTPTQARVRVDSVDEARDLLWALAGHPDLSASLEAEPEGAGAGLAPRLP